MPDTANTADARESPCYDKESGAPSALAAPKDKLDAPASAGVNGPEGGFLADWDRIDWDRAQENVRRLRQRIFTASKDGDLTKVRNLQVD